MVAVYFSMYAIRLVDGYYLVTVKGYVQDLSCPFGLGVNCCHIPLVSRSVTPSKYRL